MAYNITAETLREELAIAFGDRVPTPKELETFIDDHDALRFTPIRSEDLQGFTTIAAFLRVRFPGLEQPTVLAVDMQAFRFDPRNESGYTLESLAARLAELQTRAATIRSAVRRLTTSV